MEPSRDEILNRPEPDPASATSATMRRTVTLAQRQADKDRLKTPEGQAAIDALRAKMRADLRARAAMQAELPAKQSK